MSVAEVKNNLILQILQTDDPVLIEHLALYVQNLLNHQEHLAVLTEKDKEMIALGSTQIDEGKFLSDATVREKARKILEGVQ